MQTVTSAAEWTEEDASEVSLAATAMGQASALVPPTPSTAGGAVPKEALPQEGSAPLGADAESSRSLV